MERAQYLYIDSKRCVGNPHNFKVTLPANVLQCGKNESIRMSLVRWTCRHDWYTIRAPENTFYVNDTAVTLPEGNYKYAQWAQVLEIALQSVAPGTKLGYSQRTNKLTFTFPDASSRTFTFPHRRTRAWGFLHPVVTTNSSVLTSAVPLNFYDDDERILISCEGVQPRGGRHLSHGRDGSHANVENVLACVLVNNAPYETLLYESDGKAFGQHIHDGHVHSTLHFSFHTTDGTACTWLPHSHMVLKFESHVDHTQLMLKQLNVLRSMEDVLKMLLVSQHLATRDSDLGTPTGESDQPPAPQN